MLERNLKLGRPYTQSSGKNRTDTGDSSARTVQAEVETAWTGIHKIRRQSEVEGVEPVEALRSVRRESLRVPTHGQQARQVRVSQEVEPREIPARLVQQHTQPPQNHLLKSPTQPNEKSCWSQEL